MKHEDFEWLKKALFKSNGALDGSKLNDGFIPPSIMEELQAQEGTDLRDKVLMAVKGPIHCAGCGLPILPYPRNLGADKAHYCGKSCMPKAKVFHKECVICGKGFDTPLKNSQTCGKECKAALVRQNLKEKYGVEHIAHIEGVEEKKRKTNLERYGNEYSIASEDVKRKIKDSMYARWEGGHNMRDTEFRMAYGLFYHRESPESVQTFRSDRIRNLYEFLDCIGLDYIITPLELDVFIPSHNLAIEVNGSYWHGEQFKPANYHQNKTLACHDKGIRLIHLWDWTDIEKLKMAILSAVKPVKLDARKCAIGSITSQQAKEFCDKHHMQAGIHAKHNFGLFLSGELAMVATFSKPRFSKEAEWELIRLCSAGGVRVRGGASRLMKYARKILGGSILTYSSIDMGINTVYERCGFRKIGVTFPGYRWANHHESIPRYKTQKHKLKELLGEGFDAGLTESENMMNNGWAKVYDCGNEVFILETV